MKTFATTLLAACAFAALSTPAHATSSCETLEANKKAAIDLLHQVFNKMNPDAVDQYIGAPYFEHNPLDPPDSPQALKQLTKILTNESQVVFGEAVASGDLVFVDSWHAGMPGYATSVIVDVFRFENGKIVEHWDRIQPDVPASKTASGRPMYPVQSKEAKHVAASCGGGCDSLSAQEEANKKAGVALLDEMFNKKNVAAVDTYVGTTYMEHNPLLSDGPQSLKDVTKTLTSETKVEFGAVIAAGDLVWIDARYSGIPGVPTSVSLDVFRFENGKVVEHWVRMQEEVPAEKAFNGLPMFPIKG